MHTPFLLIWPALEDSSYLCTVAKIKYSFLENKVPQKKKKKKKKKKKELLECTQAVNLIERGHEPYYAKHFTNRPFVLMTRLSLCQTAHYA